MEQILLIFVPKVPPRISYTFSLFFDSLLQTPYKITTNAEEYKTYIGPKLNYSEQQLNNDELYISSSPLLFETGIHLQAIIVSEWNGLNIFYQTRKGILPFDIFASSFYLVSRYEEYLSNDFDLHKRYKPENSLAYKNQFLDRPLVDLWAKELKKILLEKYPELLIKEGSYKFIPTLDIDVAYAHLGRTLKITTGSFLQAIFKFNLAFAGDKVLTLLGFKKDNYDTYDYQEIIFKKYNLRPIYFILAAKWAQFDKNISTQGKRFVNLLRRLQSFADIGIHPSYQSNNNPEIVEQEIKRLEKHLNSPITKSRQHFLKMSLPETYRCLAKFGITDDYTLAHAFCPGFRASICTPFFFYDLKEEKTLPVKIHSIQVMEGTLRECTKNKPDEAIPIIHRLINETKKCNGEFIAIWHNHTLNNRGDWTGWKNVFEAMIEYGIST